MALECVGRSVVGMYGGGEQVSSNIKRKKGRNLNRGRA